jgi:cell wall-associated NlpC family hydrolase
VSRLRLPCVLLALVLCAALPASVAQSAPDAHSAASVRSKAVAWAVAQAGTRERGTTNCAPKIDRWQRGMGLRVPPCRVWCGAYVHQAFLRAGVRLSARLIDPDRSFGDAVAGRRGLTAIPRADVRPGDLLFFAFRPGLRASHLAIVRSRPRGGQVLTAEGNVSNAVRLDRRGVRFAVLAARVDVG